MNTRMMLSINFILMILIPLVFVGMLTSQATEHIIRNEIVDKLGAIASLKEARIDTAVERNYERINTVTVRQQVLQNLGAINGGDRAQSDRITAMFSELRSTVSDFREIWVLNTSGDVIISVPFERRGQNYAGKQFFQRGMERPYISDIQIDADGTPIFYLSGPYVLNGTTLGVAVIVSDARVISRIADDRTGLGTTGTTYLFRPEGDGKISFITEQRFDVYHNLSLKKLAQQTLAFNATEGETLSDTGQPILIAARYLNTTGWGMIVAIDKETASAPVRRIQTTFLIILFIVLTFSLFIAWLIARAVAEPVTEITRAINEISKGKLDATIDPRAKEATDEVKSLVDAFERTIVSVKLAAKRNTECIVRKDDEGKTIVTGKTGKTKKPKK